MHHSEETGKDVVPWWNTDYIYRRAINFTDTNNINHTNVPVDVYMTFPNGECYNNSIRLQYWNGSHWLDEESLPYQIWNETFYSGTSYYKSLTITFYVNVSALSTSTYYIYYNNSYSGVDWINLFTPEVTVTAQLVGSYTDYVFTGDYFNVTASPNRNYGGKFHESWNKISEKQWSCGGCSSYIIEECSPSGNGFHWNPDYATGSTSGHKPTSHSLEYTGGPLFIKWTATTPMDTTSEAICNVTYRVFRWGWIGETNTTFYTTYTSNYRYRNNEWVFDPRVMPNLRYKSSTGVIFQSDNFAWAGQSIGQVQWFCFWDPNDGEAVGTGDIVEPIAHVQDHGPWTYRVFGSTTYYQFWDRCWPDTKVAPGDYMYEKFFVYIWDGHDGPSEFESFAESMKHPPQISVGDTETIFFTVNINVVDYDGHPLPGANVSIYQNGMLNCSVLTNPSGQAVVYLYNGTYNFTTVWNDTHTTATGGTFTATYKNETMNVDVTDHMTITIKFTNLTTLVLKVVDNKDYILQEANVTIKHNQTGELINTGLTNLSGWVELHVNRSEFYKISVWAEGQEATLNVTQDPYPITSRKVEVVKCTNIAEFHTEIHCDNGTQVKVTWGSDVILVFRWVNETGEYLNSSDGDNVNSSGDAYFKYQVLNSSEGEVVPWTEVTAQGSGGDVYYRITIPWRLLFGGEGYTINVKADASSYSSAVNFTSLSIALVTPEVTCVSLTGDYYWNRTDVVLWVHVSNPVNTTFVVDGAVVHFSTEHGEVSGTMTYQGAGNYTYTLSKNVIGENLSAKTYTITFTIECQNYTTVSLSRSLPIKPIPTGFNHTKIVDVVYGDMVNVFVNYTDSLDNVGISDAIVTFYVAETSFAGSLSEQSPGYYVATFNSSELPAGYYVMWLSAMKDNFESGLTAIPLVIESVPTMVEVKATTLTVAWKDLMNVTVTIRDTHNNVTVPAASVHYELKNSTGHVVYAGTLTPIGNGSYYLQIDTQYENTTPGKYELVIWAELENYTTSSETIFVTITGIRTAYTPQPIGYISDLTSPKIIQLGPFIQVENDVPLILFTFSYVDEETGNPVPNATVTLNGVPMVNLGGGTYGILIPTQNLPPSPMLLVVKADAPNYMEATSYNLLVVKEKAIPIPGTSLRVPLTLLLAIVGAVAIPTASFATYSYVKRLRIPAVIRRIDALIDAIAKGEPVTVGKPLTRDAVVERLLREELAVVGVEPRAVRYVPPEVADRLVPLLVEIGKSEGEAHAILAELRASTPAEREKLLETVGVPPDISATILQELEKEEEERQRKAEESMEAVEEGEEDIGDETDKTE